MLTVKTPEEVQLIIDEVVRPLRKAEELSLAEACGRILYEDIIAEEFVPDFNRSTVDGYAVRAEDTYGCSEAIPAILNITGEILMGEDAGEPIGPGECRIVPTGGAMPQNSDAAVMIEYTENYGDGTVGIMKPAAAGMNVIFKGDDVRPGKCVIKAGRKIGGPDIGALAAMGYSKLKLAAKPLVGIISTGDELVTVGETPAKGQMRDVNSSSLHAFCIAAGAEAKEYGIIRDDEKLLDDALSKALEECDMVLISGGSSVGTKDASYRTIKKHGEILLHGIAMKPGKPTILGLCDGKPVVGLPGHPAAAYYVSEVFVKRILAVMQGFTLERRYVTAVLSETIGANHGRAQYTGVVLREDKGVLYADPIHSKSGLISSLAGADGFFEISRDSEGIAAGEQIRVYQF